MLAQPGQPNPENPKILNQQAFANKLQPNHQTGTKLSPNWPATIGPASKSPAGPNVGSPVWLTCTHAQRERTRSDERLDLAPSTCRSCYNVQLGLALHSKLSASRLQRPRKQALPRETRTWTPLHVRVSTMGLSACCLSQASEE